MSINRKLMTVCCAAVLALGLAACGSSDDDTADTTPTTEMPEPMQTPAEQLAAARMAVEDAEAAVAAAATAADRASAYTQLAAAQQLLADAESIPENVLADLQQRLTDAEDDLGEANTAATNLRAAVDAINAARAAAAALDADSDQAAVTAAGDLVTDAQTAVDALGADDQARLQSQVNGSNYMVMAAQTRLDNAATVAANTKAAGTKETAIGVEAGQETDAGLGGTDAPATTDSQNAGEYNLAIKHGETSITVEGATEDDDVKFVDQEAGLDAGRTMLVREMKADDDGNVVTEVAIVGTDIKAPKATAFATVYPFDANPNDADPPVNQSLEIDADNLAMISTDGITSVGAGQITVLAAVEDDDQTMDVDETVAAFETDATFDGAEGTLKCAGATDCTVTLDADGDITAFGNGWEFTPDPKITVDVPDANYLSYGFWLKKTADADDATTYNEVETFAMATGHPETGDSDLSEVEGSATYDGDAVGVYVKNVLDDQANIVSATSGHFKAGVVLNANFGGGNVAANDQFTIGGTVTGFDLQHGETNDWAVSLGLADLSGGRVGGGDPGKSAPGSSHNNEFSGVATGDSTAAAGSWNGAFYGSSEEVDHDMDNATPVINPQPVAVIGEFNANFTDGTAAGGYGANKK